jgi:ABC-2 type transport system permease protein
MMRYLKLFIHIFNFNVRSAMEYRLNFFAKLFHGPAYVGVLYLLLRIAYLHSDHLVGWPQSEAFLLFGVYQLMFAMAMVLFMPGIRYYMWEGFRYGAFDSIMLKPANTQFLATFAHPHVHHLPLGIGLLALVCYHFIELQLVVFSLPFIFFIISFGISLVICYLFFTLFMTLGFYVTKAGQIIEFLDKMTDYGQYPTPLFPETLQAVFFTLIPIAFMGYVPTGILLGRLGWEWLGYMAVVALCFHIANHLAWKQAIKHYSSASS